MKRQLTVLANGTRINVANMNDKATLEGQIVLAGASEPKPNKRTGVLEYRFVNVSTGWFTAINTADTERLANVLANPEGDEFSKLVLVATAIKDVAMSATTSLKPAFVGGAL